MIITICLILTVVSFVIKYFKQDEWHSPTFQLPAGLVTIALFAALAVFTIMAEDQRDRAFAAALFILTGAVELIDSHIRSLRARLKFHQQGKNYAAVQSQLQAVMATNEHLLVTQTLATAEANSKYESLAEEYKEYRKRANADELGFTRATQKHGLAVARYGTGDWFLGYTDQDSNVKGEVLPVPEDWKYESKTK